MQLTYSPDTPIGIHGMKVEAYPSAIVTGLATAGVIQVGVVVIYDPTVGGDLSKSIKAPEATGDVTTLLGVAGITLWDPTYPEPPYRKGAALPVMRKGRIAIVAETTLTVHTNPFVRFTVGAPGTLLGALRGDADTANAVAAPYLQVISGAAAGGVAVVEIDL